MDYVAMCEIAKLLIQLSTRVAYTSGLTEQEIDKVFKATFENLKERDPSELQDV